VRATRKAFPVALALATAVSAAFLLLPLVAIFTRVPFGSLLEELGSGVVTDAILVSLKTTLIAQAAILLLGTPTAYFLAMRNFRGRELAVTLVELPLVLPPAVAGIGLLAAFGRFGLLGSTLRVLGVEIPFTQTAVVLAVAFVASPLYVRQAIAAFAAVDQQLIDASRTPGASQARTFARVALPLAREGLLAGCALSFARGLGEFGATIMFAGSLQGVTQTLPLAIYAQFESRFEVALAIGGLLVFVSALILVVLKLPFGWKRSASTSSFLFVRSRSS
jgi:molybdate transport system permease protein